MATGPLKSSLKRRRERDLQRERERLQRERLQRPEFAVAATTLGGVLASVTAGLAGNLDSDSIANTGWGAIATVSAVTIALFLLILGVLSQRAAVRASRAAVRSDRAFRAAAAQVVTSVEQTAVKPEASLEDEISEVSSSLSESVSRLRQLSRKAEAFESEVKDLVAHAEAAKATARLHEDDARRIGVFLGAETESRLRSEIEKLTAEHNRLIDQLRREGTRTALWTFVGGVVLGLIGNVVVALLLG